MEHLGFVAINRKIMNNFLWKGYFSEGQAWIDLIMCAKYKDEDFLYEGKLIHGKRGTVYRSVSSLAERWGWSRDKTRKFLDLIEGEKMIRRETTTHWTQIHICNYDIYQNIGNEKSRTGVFVEDSQTSDNHPADNRQPSGTYNKRNKENQENNENQMDEGNLSDDWFDSLSEVEDL